MLKVLKFGGSSMADAKQFEKVKSIVQADPGRRVVVVSAAGKRFSEDHKLTDLLYLCHAHLKYGVACDSVFDMIRSRYIEIRDDLGLKTDLESEFDALRKKMDAGISQDELVSRGEYFAARLMADYLGYDFLDSELWLKFNLDGTVDQDLTYETLARTASGDPGLLRHHARRQHQDLHPGRQRHHRRPGGGGSGRGRIRELDGCVGLPHGRPPDRGKPPDHSGGDL